LAIIKRFTKTKQFHMSSHDMGPFPSAKVFEAFLQIDFVLASTTKMRSICCRICHLKLSIDLSFE